MAYRRRISREELLELVGVLAPMQGNWGQNNEPYAIISKRDLEFVHNNIVRIRRNADGSVRVDLKRFGRPTI